MLNINGRWRILAAASLAAASLAGCGGGNEGGAAPVAPPPQTSTDFSSFATQTFANSANSTPVSVNYTFNFDVNDDPTAFDTLIASGSYQ